MFGYQVNGKKFFFCSKLFLFHLLSILKIYFSSGPRIDLGMLIFNFNLQIIFLDIVILL